MNTDVTVEFTFEAAHWLPLVPDGHKCKTMHGHSYKVAVTVSGPVRDDGMVIDFADIRQDAQPLINELDHQTLNDFIDNPTCENVSRYLYEHIPCSTWVTVRETDHAYCTYPGRVLEPENGVAS